MNAPPKDGVYSVHMVESAVKNEPLSVEEYLRLEERAQATKHEYVGGLLYAMVGASRRHDTIAGNVFGLLWSSLGDGPCRVYTSDRRLRAGAEVFYYPDAMVVCEASAADEDPSFEESPSLVVEVTSPSTAATDRREKLAAYRRMPTLEAYLIIEQSEKRVEVHARDEQEQWWLSVHKDPDGAVDILHLGLKLPLARIYARV